MSTSEVSLLVPNTVAAEQCRQAINYYAPIKLADIQFEVLKSDLKLLVQYLAASDQQTNSALAKANNHLRVDEVQQVLDDIGEQTGDDQTASKKELKTLMNNLKTAITKLRNEIETPRYNLETMQYTPNPGRLEIFRKSIDGLHALSKESGIGEYDELLAQKKLLDGAIKIYQDQTLYDKMQPVIAEVDKVAQSSDSPAEFKVKMVKSSVGLVNKLLKTANDEVKYDDIVKARETLATQLKVFEARNNDTDKKLKETYEIIAEVEDFESLRAPKKQYADEVKKIVDSFDSFIEVVFASAAPEDQASSFVSHAPKFNKYVNDITKKWLRTS